MDNQPTNEIGGKLPVRKPSGRHVVSKILSIRRKIAPKQGLYVVVVPRIYRRISEDKTSRNVVVEEPWR